MQDAGTLSLPHLFLPGSITYPHLASFTMGKYPNKPGHSLVSMKVVQDLQSLFQPTDCTITWEGQFYFRKSPEKPRSVLALMGVSHLGSFTEKC